MPVHTCEQTSGSAERRAVERTLRALGFTAASNELTALPTTVEIDRSSPNQKAGSIHAGLKLVPLGQAADRDHTPIDLPPYTQLTEAQLIGDVVVCGWVGNSRGSGVALRAPAPLSLPPPPAAAAPPAAPAPRSSR
jgi:hypothetical protein